MHRQAIFATAYGALWITQTRLGLGLVPADRPPENLPQYGRENYAGRPIYVFSTLCFKLALCISYLRLTRGAHNGTARLAIWIGLIFTLLYNIAYILSLLFACSPVAKSWDYSLEGKCLPMRPFYYTTSVLTMLNDLVLFLLPVPLIWRLKMNKRTKFGLSVMFLLALVTTVCSAMRIVAITYIEKTGNTTAFILWGVIEACVGVSRITCVCQSHCCSKLTIHTTDYDYINTRTSAATSRREEESRRSHKRARRTTSP